MKIKNFCKIDYNNTAKFDGRSLFYDVYVGYSPEALIQPTEYICRLG